MAATRTKFQRERDLEYISNLYLQGWSQQRIAEKLASERDYEVSRVTIGNDLKEVNRRWQENTNIPIDQHRLKELARIDLLEQTYWTQWIASLEDRTIKTKSGKSQFLATKKKNGDVETTPQQQVNQTSSERTETREGNPAFLQGVERCIKLRCDLLGLNAPLKVKQEDWRTQAIEDIKAGRIDYKTLSAAFDDNLAMQLFAAAGKPVMVLPDDGTP